MRNKYAEISYVLLLSVKKKDKLLYDAIYRKARPAAGALIDFGARYSKKTVCDVGGKPKKMGSVLSMLCDADWDWRKEAGELVEKILATPESKNILNQGWGEIPHTPLHFAARSRQRNILKQLLKAGANPNPPPNQKHLITPLMMAAATGDLQSLKILTDNLAEIFHEDENGRNALFYTAFVNPHEKVTEEDLIESAQYLVAQGLDPLRKDNFGYTPKDCARQENLNQLANYFFSFEIDQELSPQKTCSPQQQKAKM